MARVRIESNNNLHTLLKVELGVRLTSAANEVHNALISEVLVGNRSGRTYYVPGTKTAYVASRAGEAPASATGDLRRSYRPEVDLKNLKAYVGSELDYAGWLEQGTKRMDARPHLVPAMQRSFERVMAILNGAG